MRLVGSSHANLFASISAGINALWGPRHGGANVAVIDMLETIHAGKATPEEYVKLAKDKDSGVRLMGFGHRVYKSLDPRAVVLQRVAEKLLANLGQAFLGSLLDGEAVPAATSQSPGYPRRVYLYNGPCDARLSQQMVESTRPTLERMVSRPILNAADWAARTSEEGLW